MKYPQKECRKCGRSKNEAVIDSNRGLCDDCADSEYRKTHPRTPEMEAFWREIELPDDEFNRRHPELKREMDAGVNHLFRRGVAGALD